MFRTAVAMPFFQTARSESPFRFAPTSLLLHTHGSFMPTRSLSRCSEVATFIPTSGWHQIIQFKRMDTGVLLSHHVGRIQLSEELVWESLPVTAALDFKRRRPYFEAP